MPFANGTRQTRALEARNELAKTKETVEETQRAENAQGQAKRVKPGFALALEAASFRTLIPPFTPRVP